MSPKSPSPASDPTHAFADVPPPALEVTTCIIDGERYVVLSHPVAAEHGDALAGLSGAEREVVELLMAGLSQAEIAAHRSTSPRTIAKQLESAYRRLGVGSRAELAARLEERRNKTDTSRAGG